MRSPNGIRQLAAVAARQHGNVSLADLERAGLDRHMRKRLASEGWLTRRHAGVYAMGHVPRTRPSRWMAAVLALGPGARLSHRAAAAHWWLLDGAVPTEVTVAAHRSCRNRDGIVVHRMPVPDSHRAIRDGIPVTSLVRTLLDLAMVVRLRTLERAFEQAQVHHHLPPELLGAEVLSRRGYRGNARLRHVLDGAVRPDAVRSILELRFLRLCARHAIERPLVNHRLGVWTPDFLWPEPGLVVETDGVRFHRTAAARRRDQEKDAALRATGLRVIRLTWSDVVEREVVTAGIVRAALSNAA